MDNMMADTVGIKKSEKKDFSKFLTEFLPLLAFIISYKLFGIIVATLVIVATTLVMVVVSYTIYKKISPMMLFTASILSIFGAFTYFTNDPIYIKIKPTILNALFAIILIIGYVLKKPFLKYILDFAIQLPDKVWLTLSLRWGIFFIFLSILNEIIWRNFSESFWVSFKLLGFLPITLIFTLSQMPFIMKNAINLKDGLTSSNSSAESKVK